MEFITVDIDDTLIKADLKRCEHCGSTEYSNPKPIQEEIDRVNSAKASGVAVILHTGRSWGHYQTTVDQLKELGINYDGLIMGKPPGPYIDSTLNFKSLSEVNNGQ